MIKPECLVCGGRMQCVLGMGPSMPDALKSELDAHGFTPQTVELYVCEEADCCRVWEVGQQFRVSAPPMMGVMTFELKGEHY